MRSDHPAMFDAPRAHARTRSRFWFPALAVLLVANLLLLAVALLRTPAPSSDDRHPTSEATDSVASPSDTSDSTPQPTRVGAARHGPTNGSTVVARGAAAAAATADPGLDAVPTITRDDLIASGLAVPEAMLGLHVYDPNPAARFVFLNGQKLGEGGSSREGLRVAAITPRATVLEFRGSRFAIATDLP